MAINITGTSCPNKERTCWPSTGVFVFFFFRIAKGDPEKKLKWAFKMYDIDSNGSIDRSEMLKIIEVNSRTKKKNAKIIRISL